MRSLVLAVAFVAALVLSSSDAMAQRRGGSCQLPQQAVTQASAINNLALAGSTSPACLGGNCAVTAAPPVALPSQVAQAGPRASSVALCPQRSAAFISRGSLPATAVEPAKIAKR